MLGYKLIFLSFVFNPATIHGSLLANQPFIVGGVEATRHEFPWQVSLRQSLNNFHICGGVILDAATVLTTASCAEILEPNLSTVGAGKHNISAEELESQQIVKVTSTHLHPGYPGSTDYSNDIAVVKVTPAFQWTQYVKPMENLQESYDISQENGIISGWGTKLEEELALQDILHKVTVRLIKNTQDCQVAVGDDMIIENSMICVTSPSDNPADSCTGDQGGPLTAAREDGEVVLIGLISFGIGCGRPNLPSFCTRISPYLDFIRRYQENNG